jgi:hypothetical protein
MTPSKISNTHAAHKQHTLDDPHFGTVRFRALSPDELSDIRAEVSMMRPDLRVAKDPTLANASTEDLRAAAFDLRVMQSALLDEGLRRRIGADGQNPKTAAPEDGVAFVRIVKAILEKSGGEA